MAYDVKLLSDHETARVAAHVVECWMHQHPDKTMVPGEYAPYRDMVLEQLGLSAMGPQKLYRYAVVDPQLWMWTKIKLSI